MVLAYFPLRAFLVGADAGVVENFLYFLHEILGQARLGDERVAAGLLRALRDAGERVAGQRDDRNAGGALVGFETARRLPAVHDGEREVHEDDVGRGVERGLQRFHAVRRLHDLEAAVLEVLAVHLAGVRIVVDDQHAPLVDFLFHTLVISGSELGASP